MPVSQPSPELGGGYDWHGDRVRDDEKVGIAGHQPIGTSSHCQFKKRAVRRVPALRDEWWRIWQGDRFAPRKVVVKQFALERKGQFDV